MINEKHSHKDYSNRCLKHLPAEEFSNTTIVGTCFSQEVLGGTPMLIDIFPDGTKNVTFERSNLINVFMPKDSATDSDCSTQKVLSKSTGNVDVDKDDALSKVKPLKMDRASLVLMNPANKKRGDV